MSAGQLWSNHKKKLDAVETEIKASGHRPRTSNDVREATEVVSRVSAGKVCILCSLAFDGYTWQVLVASFSDIFMKSKDCATEASALSIGNPSAGLCMRRMSSIICTNSICMANAQTFSPGHRLC